MEKVRLFKAYAEFLQDTQPKEMDMELVMQNSYACHLVLNDTLAILSCHL